MKILITGASGFIGLNLTKFLLVNGYKYEDIIPVYHNNPVENGWCCDLTNGEAVKYLLEKTQPDVIVHCAANPNPKHPANPKQMLDDNVLTTLNLLEGCKEGTKFVFLSSITVYGDEYPLERPTSLYGASKLASEAIITAYAKLKHINPRIIRTCAVVGQGTTHGLLFDLQRKLRSDSPELELFGNEPGTRKPFVHVNELCLYIKNISIELDDEFFYSEKFNDFWEVTSFGPKDSASVKEIAETVMNKLNIHKPIKWLGDGTIWKGDNRALSYDCGIKINNHWETIFSSLQAVENAVS
jgi:UDP-glucose 4-epimerase